MLSVITVFTLHAPPGVMFVQNILYPCINYCTQCFGSDNIFVSIKLRIRFLYISLQQELKISSKNTFLKIFTLLSTN